MADRNVELAQQMIAAHPFAGALRIEVTAAEAGEVRARMEWAPELCTVGGILHGGALVTLADTLNALCAGLNTPPGKRSSTLELKANFFRPAGEGRVETVTRPMHVGRTSVVVQTEVFDAEGRRVALVTQTQAVRPIED